MLVICELHFKDTLANSPLTKLISYAPMFVPFALGAWAMGAVAGPVFGPIVGGFAAAAKGWSWPIWELMWISGFSAVFLVFFLPETLPGTILLKRARRLRKLTGNDRLRSMSEIEQAEMSASAVAAEYLIRPFQLMLEPAILFINIYIGRKYRYLMEVHVVLIG